MNVSKLFIVKIFFIKLSIKKTYKKWIEMIRIEYLSKTKVHILQKKK